MRINVNVSPHLPELKIDLSILTVTKNVLDTTALLYSVQYNIILYRPLLLGIILQLPTSMPTRIYSYTEDSIYHFEI